jgi:hypothetical protein
MRMHANSLQVQVQAHPAVMAHPTGAHSQAVGAQQTIIHEKATEKNNTHAQKQPTR